MHTARSHASASVKDIHISFHISLDTYLHIRMCMVMCTHVSCCSIYEAQPEKRHNILTYPNVYMPRMYVPRYLHTMNLSRCKHHVHACNHVNKHHSHECMITCT
jgi:hypothetical protein